MHTMTYAVCDTNANLMHWLGSADDPAHAVSLLMQDVGGGGEARAPFHVYALTDQQTVAIQAWWDDGAKASAWPEGLPAPVLVSPLL